MGIIALADRVRKDPLGALWHNYVLRNATELQRLILRGHNSDGTHNDLEVPRIIGGITNTAGVASVTSGSEGIASVSGFTDDGATGTATITLTSGLLASLDGGSSYPACMDVMVTDAEGENLPFLPTVEMVSSTSVRVRLRKLASLAGNTWDAADGSFHLAIYSPRHPDTSTPLTTITPASYGHGLRASKWSQLVANLAAQYKNITAGHKVNGVHNTPHVARGWVKSTWDGADFNIASGESLNITAVTNPSSGRAALTLAGGTFANPLWVFARPGALAASPEQQFLITCPNPDTTGASLYMYAYDEDSNTWSRAECDFDAFVHSAAV